jgi:hypothetical protein
MAVILPLFRESLLPKEELNRIWILRKVLNPLSPVEAMELMLERLSKTNSNRDSPPTGLLLETTAAYRGHPG